MYPDLVIRACGLLEERFYAQLGGHAEGGCVPPRFAHQVPDVAPVLAMHGRASYAFLLGFTQAQRWGDEMRWLVAFLRLFGTAWMGHENDNANDTKTCNFTSS
jgi:hypothetical protein